MPRRPSLTGLVKAAKAWDVSALREIVSVRPELVHEKDRTRRTALHYVATQDARKRKGRERDSVNSARTLLDAGADIDAVHEIADDDEVFPATPLWHAYARGHNLTLLRWLLKQGASPENTLWACAWNDDADTAKLLISNGASIDPVFHGQTPFFEGVGWRRWKFARQLAKAGADIGFRGPNGETVLHVAIRKKFKLSEIRELLELGADPELTDADGESAIELADRLNRTGVLRVLKELRS